MGAYESSVHTGSIVDAQGERWTLRFDTSAAIEAELCCKEQYGREIGYLTIAGGAIQRVYYAMLAIVYGAAVSAARWARMHGETPRMPVYAAFERAFPLTALLGAQAEIAEGIYAYLPPADGKKKDAAQGAGRK